MSNARVAVLRGGPSEEYQYSLKAGASVIASLNESGNSVKDIVITRQGDWLNQGYLIEPENALKAVDVVFVALQGNYGEDGDVQKIMQRMHIPFTGSRAFPSAIAFNKQLTKQTLGELGVLMPKHHEVSREYIDEIDEIVTSIQDSFGPEYIIKPVSGGSSVGVQFVRAGQSLEDALKEALVNYEKVLVEEYIRGREVTSATLENFRNEQLYVFPSIEIVTPKEYPFFSTDLKYSGKAQDICPARFTYSERDKIAEVSALAHQALNLSQYSRSDFIVNNHGVYFLEVNSLPSLANESLYPKAAAAVGMSYQQLISHLLDTATC